MHRSKPEIEERLKNFVTQQRTRWAAKLFGFFAMLVVALAACAGGSDSDPSHVALSGPSDGGSAVATGTGGAGVPAGDCNAGDKRACHITLGQHEGVLSCFVGLQLCVEGAWGECGDGKTVAKVPAMDDGTPLSLTDQKVCDDNPCDPRCKKWAEDGKWKADGSVCKWVWSWSAAPADNIKKANTAGAASTPCTAGSDCQQNQKCQDPAQGSCSHDICTKGAGLKKGCEEKCVDAVCTGKPQCCEKLYGGTCAKEPCLTNTKGLVKTCDPTVTKVCDWDKTCCPYTVKETCSYWDIVDYKTVCKWVDTYVCGWELQYLCGWHTVYRYTCGWHWVTVYLCGWHWTWIQVYLCGWRWRYIYTYLCGWRWRYVYTYICGWRYIYTYICGWRWRYVYTYICGWRYIYTYICGWRWRYIYTYICGWRYIYTYICGWRWRYIYTYICGWRWKTVYICGWRWTWVTVYVCGWRWVQTYLCGWTWVCDWWGCYYTYTCWWDYYYTYDCWWETQYVYTYECWWETQYVYECWWENVYTYLYECWWEYVYTYGCWWEDVYTYLYECWWEDVYTYLYECWWELRYVYIYECWWETQYQYDCGWYWETVYECWWENVYVCWWELVEECWEEPIYGWVYYSCDKDYDGEWKQACVDQYKVYDPGTCPMSWTGDWDATCLNAVHDTCHDYCDGVSKGAGACVEWTAPNYDDKCDAFELGVGLTCKGSTSVIPICNTGAKEAPKGIPIAILKKGSGYFGGDTTTLTGATYCYTPSVIPAGECRNVTTCDVLDGQEVVVNPKSNASYDKTECYAKDNWGFYYTDVCGYPPKCPGGYSDTTKTEPYESTCAAGLTPQWGYLSWDSTTPTGTEVAFRVRSAATKADLANGTWSTVTRKSTEASPDCSASGPAPCPIDLYDLLGKQLAQKPFLELEVKFTVDTDKKSTPTLETWEVSYTCLEQQ